MKRVLLIVTGSIAAYKCIDLARGLEELGAELDIIVTGSAKHFVAPLAFKSMTSARIYDDAVFSDSNPMLHIELAKRNDLVIIAPATADYIAKLACGIADTLSLCALLAYRGPVLIAPAMNPAMLENKATQHNLVILRERGVQILDPIHGVAACKDVGYGKYAGNEQVLSLASRILGIESGRLKGLKVAVTLGGTREMLDPVRFISNSSSGAQGVCIINDFIKEGADVTAIAGVMSCALPSSTKVVQATSARQMLQASMSALPVDVFIGCAAVCDFAPAKVSESKIKKNDSGHVVLELVNNPDVIAEVAHQPQGKRPRFVIAFALESDNHLKNAQTKLKRKAVDLIVLNKVQYMGEDSNDYTLISNEGARPLGILKKSELSAVLVEEVVKYITPIAL